jgi:hypothetical protein
MAGAARAAGVRGYQCLERDRQAQRGCGGRRAAGREALCQNLYDQRHATALFNRAQDALTGAELQLQELAPLASANYPKAGEPLGRARSTLVSAQGELRTLAGAINRNGNDVERIKSVFHQLDTAEHALNDTAGAMSVDSKLNAP